MLPQRSQAVVPDGAPPHVQDLCECFPFRVSYSFLLFNFSFSIFKEHSLERDATLGLGTLRLSPFLGTAPDSSQALVTDEVQELRVGPWPQLPRREARWKQGGLYKSLSTRISCQEATKGMLSLLRYLPRCLSDLEPSRSV